MARKNLTNKIEFSDRDTEQFFQVDEVNATEENRGRFDFPVVVYDIDVYNLDMHRIRWHWHDEIEIVVVTEGEITFHSEDCSINLQKGDGIFINQNLLHSISAPSDQTAKIITTVFHPAYLFGYGQTSMSVKYLTPILENPHMHHFVFKKEDHRQSPVWTYIHELFYVYKKREYTYEILCKSLLCNIWSHLLKEYYYSIPSQKQTKRIVNDEQRIKQAIMYIEEHFKEPITLDDIADSIHISKGECCRCFKRSLKVTPFEYLNKYRIFYATKMIQRKDECSNSISTLAISVGFSNISYFNKVFRKYIGMTPTEYRQKRAVAPALLSEIALSPIKHNQL